MKPLQPTKAYPLLGITAWQGDTNVALLYPSPAEQIKASAGQVFNTIGALFSKSEIGVQQLGGAVMIVRVYTNLFQDEDGWRRVLWFSVILNVNLALINMLPLPVLDGGHITLSLIEWSAAGRCSAKVLNASKASSAGCSSASCFTSRSSTPATGCAARTPTAKCRWSLPRPK